MFHVRFKPRGYASGDAGDVDDRGALDLHACMIGPGGPMATMQTTASALTQSRINLRSGLAEKFAETGLLVSSGTEPVACAWPGLVWFDLI